MITKKEQQQLKLLIGPQYTDSILEILKRKKVVNRKGAPYSQQYIRMVFQGHRNNIQIEHAIWELANSKKTENEKINQHKSIILDT